MFKVMDWCTFRCIFGWLVGASSKKRLSWFLLTKFQLGWKKCNIRNLTQFSCLGVEILTTYACIKDSVTSYSMILPISSGVSCSWCTVANNQIVSSKAHTCLVVLMQEGYFRLKTDYLPSKTDCNTITAGSARQEISLLDRVCSAVHCSTIQCNTVHCTILHWCRVH